jgi:hypothetical protein
VIFALLRLAGGALTGTPPANPFHATTERVQKREKSLRPHVVSTRQNRVGRPGRFGKTRISMMKASDSQGLIHGLARLLL